MNLKKLIDRNFLIHLFGEYALAILFGWWAIIPGIAREAITKWVICRLPEKWQKIAAKLTFTNSGWSWFDIWTDCLGVMLGVVTRKYVLTMFYYILALVKEVIL